jgi:hypothetical protein
MRAFHVRLSANKAPHIAAQLSATVLILSLSFTLGMRNVTLALAQQEPSVIPRQTGSEVPGRQDNGANTLTLPEVWRPTKEVPLPAPPPVVSNPKIPSVFIGCWEANPGAFDEVTYTAPLYFQIGAPGKVVFCYQEHIVEVPEASIYISPLKRAEDIAINLGLGFETYKAHGISTDVYQVSLTHIRARTTLQLDITFHFLLLFPVHQGAQVSQVGLGSHCGGFKPPAGQGR